MTKQAIDFLKKRINLIDHSSQGSRYVGMMEALRGIAGSAGTLTV